MNDHDVSNDSVDLFEDDSFSTEGITIHKTLESTPSSPEKICQDILTDIIYKLPENDEESDKTVQITSDKLNVKVKAEIKLLKQSIKAKDDEIKNFKKSPTELENKLKAETKKACELKQSRDHYKKISNDLQARDEENPEQIKHLEKEIESKQIIIKFFMSALNLPKDSEIDQPLSDYSVVDSPFSKTAPTKKLSNRTSVLNVRDQGEQRDVSDLKSMQGTSEDHEQINELPTKPAKVEIESSKCMHEAKNNNGDIYYWNEKTVVVSKKKPKADILYLQDNKKNTKTAEENIDVGGDLKKTRFCKFYKQVWRRLDIFMQRKLHLDLIRKSHLETKGENTITLTLYRARKMSLLF